LSVFISKARIINEIKELHTLKELKENIPRFKEEYSSFDESIFNDFLLIRLLIGNNTPFDITEYFIENYENKEEIRKDSDNFDFIYSLFDKRKYENFFLFLKHEYFIDEKFGNEC